MIEWKKQSGQIGKIQKTLCNTANSILGTLNRNTQQSDEGERKPKKRKHQQQADSSDHTVTLIGTHENFVSHQDTFNVSCITVDNIGFIVYVSSSYILRDMKL